VGEGSRHLGLGAEYYSALGPLDALGGPRTIHRLFGVVDLAKLPVGRVVGLNLGVGHGLGAGEEWIVKSIVGAEVR
jgi:hypothetical protein